MATLTIGTASGGYYNYRGTNSTPYAMGSSVVVATTGGNINIAATLDGIIASQTTFQCAANAGTSTFYGNLWNSAGSFVTGSAGVVAAADTVAPFTAKTFNLSDQYFARGTFYAGFTRSAADDCNWDVVNGDNTTRVGNTAGSAVNGLTGSGTGTIYRRLVGTLTYVTYDAGNLSVSASQPSNLAVTLTFAGTSGSHAKNISINWGDSTTSTLTVAASSTPAAQGHTYAAAGAKTITVTITYASTSVGIPTLTPSTSITIYTVPSVPQTFTATTASGTSVNLSWVAPSYLGSGTITYQLYRGATLLQNSSATSFSDTGLSVNTNYSYTVYASNTWGQSTGASASATTFNVPNAPQSLSVTPQTASTAVTQAVATWSAPSSDGGSAITSYEYSIDGTNWTNNSTSLSATVTSLNKYVSYTFYVRAVNVAGNSTSTTASFTTFGGRYGVYNGTSFVDKYAQKYDGSAWSNAPIRKYNGTTWEYTDR